MTGQDNKPPFYWTTFQGMLEADKEFGDERFRSEAEKPPHTECTQCGARMKQGTVPGAIWYGNTPFCRDRCFYRWLEDDPIRYSYEVRAVRGY